MADAALVTRRAIASALPLAALIAPATMSAAAAATSADPIFAQIERHKVLRLRANTVSESDPAYQSMQDEEEAAIQALGEMVPSSIAAAAAQLAYIAEIEGGFAPGGSPLLRTVLSVADGLAALQGRTL